MAGLFPSKSRRQRVQYPMIDEKDIPLFSQLSIIQGICNIMAITTPDRFIVAIYKMYMTLCIMHKYIRK